MLQRQHLADLLSDLIRAESPDPPGDERHIVRVLATHLRALGIEPMVDEFAPKRYNLLVRLQGQGTRPGLVFSAHMDTLPPGSGAWLHPVYSGHNDGVRVHGRGACDMKSGLAAMVAAAASIRQQSEPLQGDLVLAFTGGESSNCLGARHLAETQLLKGCGAILISEPTSLDLMIAEKAALWLRVTAMGTAGHLSAKPDDQTNAILSIVGLLPKLQHTLPAGDHPLLGTASLNLGRIEGGTAINLTPDRCSVDLDYRLLPDHEPGAVESALHSVLAGGGEIERLDYKPAVETSADDPFVELCRSEIADQRSIDLQPKGASYFTDACVLCPAFNLPMTIIGPGTYGGSGMVNESVLIDDVMTAAHIYRRVVLRMLC